MLQLYGMLAAIGASRIISPFQATHSSLSRDKVRQMGEQANAEGYKNQSTQSHHHSHLEVAAVQAKMFATVV
jgi:hypothetical protein